MLSPFSLNEVQAPSNTVSVGSDTCAIHTGETLNGGNLKLEIMSNAGVMCFDSTTLNDESNPVTRDRRQVKKTLRLQNLKLLN